jgi:DNA-binding GntR family transcriptional regulator
MTCSRNFFENFPGGSEQGPNRAGERAAEAVFPGGDFRVSIMTETGLLPAAPDLEPIEQTPLRVQIADRLRRAIVTAKLRPGTVLVETALAEQMNVSRAPIREAIAILENDGLVETAAYKGKRVKPLTVREVEETWSLRQTFEVMAVRRILDREADVAPLWEPCRAMQAAAEAGDREALILADEQFHRTLIALSDHHLLLQSWTALYLRIHQIMALGTGATATTSRRSRGTTRPSCGRWKSGTRGRRCG